MRILSLFFFLSSMLASPIHAQQVVEANGFTGYIYDQKHTCLSTRDRRLVKIRLERNIQDLKKEGKLTESSSREIVKLAWPLRLCL